MRAGGIAALLAAACLLLPGAASRGGAPQTAPASSSPGASIRGRVLGEGGKPVARASIRVLPEEPAGKLPAGVPQTRPAAGKVLEAKTGEDGSFAATGLPGKLFRLRAEAPGYAPFTAGEIPPGASVEVILKPGLRVAGVTLDPETRKPVAGARVVARDADAAPFGEEACSRADSGPDGRFLLVDLPPGKLEVTARAPGRMTARRSDLLLPRPAPADGSQETRLELFMAPAVRLVGKVVERGGKPVEGATVRLSRADENRAASAPEEPLLLQPSGKSGGFSFRELPPGRYRITAAKKGYADGSTGPLEVRGGSDRTDIVVRLLTGAALKVRLVDSGGRPAGDLRVELLDEAAPPEAGTEGRPVEPDRIADEGEGRYTLRHLSAGIFTLRFLSGDRGVVEKGKVRLEEGKTADLGTLVIHPGGSLSGLVTGPGGAVEGARVSAFWHDGTALKRRQVRTDAEGHYRIPGLEGVPELVRVSSAGLATDERPGPPPADGILDFFLQPRGSIAGHVEFSGGSIPAAFRVRGRLQPGSGDGEAPSSGEDPGPERVFNDGTGAFRLDDLDSGTYAIEIGVEGFPPARKEGIRVAAGQVTDSGTVTLETGSGLRGRVVDSRNGAPVMNAVIRIDPAGEGGLQPDFASGTAGSAASASDGSFAVTGLQPGSYLLTVLHPVYSPLKLRVDYQSDPETPEIVVRMSRGGTLTGTVLDSQKQPAPNVQIAITGGEGEALQAVVTGPDGRYVAESLPPGMVTVTRQPAADSPSAAPVTKTALIQDGETATLDFDETPAIRLHGRVLRGDAPLASTPILLMPVDAPPPGEFKSARSDDSGNYEIGLDHGGSYLASVGVGDPGKAGGRATVKLAVPEQADVAEDIVLPPDLISGRISGRDGKGIAGATVTAVRDAGGPVDPARQSTAQTDADGAYRLEGIDPGTYRVTARAVGYRPGEAYPVTVSDDAPSPEIDLSLDRGWVLQGKLVDPQQRGIPNGMVVVALPGQAESGILPSITDSTGGFRITSPVDGAVAVSVIASGWAPAHLDEVQPPAGDESQPVVLRAGPGGSLRIRVTGKDGQPVAGVPVALQPDPLFPGWDFIAGHTPPPPTDAAGSSLVSLLAPGDYLVTLPGRKGVIPVRVTIVEGVEAEAVVPLP